MSRAISVGKNAIRNCYPNPMVGCVIVCDNQIISEGHTSPFGGPHAEVNAINKLQDKSILSQCTLYVTLEPCAHFGNTPPCTNLIVRYQIPSVVIGILDPNPKVNGKGKAILEQAGIQVFSGVLNKECQWHHRRFLSLQTKKRPYIILKWAQSADAFIAPPIKNRKPYWISSPSSKQLTHRWRTQEHAVLIGANTLIDDQPSLDARLWKGSAPIPLYLDRDASIAPLAPMFAIHPRIICFIDLGTHIGKPINNVFYIKVDFNNSLSLQIAAALFKEGISSLIVEGGAKTLKLFIQEGLWDEARIFTSNTLLLEGVKAPEISGDIVKKSMIEHDVLEILTPKSLA